MDRRGILLGSALSAAAVALSGRPAAARPSPDDYPEHRTAARLEADRAYAARQVAALSAADDRVLDRLRARQDGAPAGLRFYRHRSAGTGTDVLVARERAAGGGLDVVVPLGYVIKAQDYPWRTEGPPAAPAVARAAVRVALVDTGLAAKRRTDGWLDGVPIGPANTDPLDVLAPAGRLDWGAGHGTFTAGIVRRVAPQCEIVAYRFTRGDGLGTDQDVAALLLRAAAEGHQAGVPTIINASLGTPGIDGAPPAAMRAAIELIAARYPDVLVVAAAGNMGTAEPVYPAAFDTVVAVGALADDLSPAPFSSHGPWLTCSTVGVGVVSTFVPGVSPPEPDPAHPDQIFGPDAWAMWTGTSFSAPQVSGAVARLCAENPGVTARAALDMLLADRPKLPGYGKVLRLLPGTPT